MTYEVKNHITYRYKVIKMLILGGNELVNFFISRSVNNKAVCVNFKKKSNQFGIVQEKH
jgi:hypothetical protein